MSVSSMDKPNVVCQCLFCTSCNVPNGFALYVNLYLVSSETYDSGCETTTYYYIVYQYMSFLICCATNKQTTQKIKGKPIR